MITTERKKTMGVNKLIEQNLLIINPPPPSPDDIIAEWPAVSLTIQQVLTEDGVKSIKFIKEQCIGGKWVVCE